VPFNDTEIRDIDAELSPSSKLARLDLSGLVLAPGEEERVGGRCDTQSWTSIDTLGLASRFSVFRDEGGVVIMMVGAFENGVEGR
jgi:hypothetical protein